MKKIAIAIVAAVFFLTLFIPPLAAAAAIAAHPITFAYTVLTDMFGYEVDERITDDPEHVSGGQIARLYLSNNTAVADLLNAKAEELKEEDEDLNVSNLINKTALIIVFYGLTDVSGYELDIIMEVFLNYSDNEAALEALHGYYFIEDSETEVDDELVLQALLTAGSTYGGTASVGPGGASSIPGLAVRNCSPDSDRSNPYFFSDRNIFYAAGFEGQCTWYSNGRIQEMAAEIGYDLDMSALNVMTGNAERWYDQALAGQSTFAVSSDVTKPAAGAIICWGGGMYNGEPCGHVAVIERVNEDGTVDYSEGWYNGSICFAYIDHQSISDIKNRAGGSGNPYFFKGYIYCVVPDTTESSDTAENAS